MTEKWRPEGWENKFIVDPDINPNGLSCKEMEQRYILPPSRAIAYEAGADAMLEALRKQKEHDLNKLVNITLAEITLIQKAGTWVFIPDDK